MTLDEFRKLTDAATPGKWGEHLDGPDDGMFEYATGPWHDQRRIPNDRQPENDAKFIAACREMVPKLIDVAEYAAAVVSELGEEGNHLNVYMGLRQALEELEK